MNYQSHWDPTQDDAIRAGLEHRLHSALYPVEPRTEYVRQLRGRLERGEGVLEEKGDFFGYLLFAVAGLASSILLVVAGVKATRSLKESWHERQMKQVTSGGPASATGAV